MPRASFSKLRVLEARHPGLMDKVHAMFAEFSPARDIKHMIETHYGERIGMRTIETYKSLHWTAQREMVEEMSEVIGSSVHRPIGPSGYPQTESGLHQAMWLTKEQVLALFLTR